MMLFADSDVSNGASVIACVLAFFTGLFSYLTAREKIKFDADVVQMKMELKFMAAEMKECQTERDAQKVQIDDLRGRLDRLAGGARPLP